ncbi:MAG: 3-(3-hydroxy-phenyl)propionate hydroxylase, partial [Mycobacterium sp.]|nr:3-(3-hydroxy-phenyl)propionate hydroxylase [Mycobacterium sp.]
NARVAALRDRVIRAASVVPTLKRYILEMRFKPMPRYDQGAIAHLEPRSATSPTGTLFIQPRVDTRENHNVLLDDVIGPGFAVLAWNNNPRSLLGDAAIARWKALGATFIAARPLTQLHWTGHDDSEVTIVGDRTGALKSFFDAHAESVLFLRPDRCIAGACIAQLAPELSTSLVDVLCLTEGGDGSREYRETAGPVLHVAQPAAESAGTGTRTP